MEKEKGGGRPGRWTAEKCAAAVDRFVEKNGRWPKIPSEAVSSLELSAPKTFQRHTGMTMGVYLKNRYPELTTPQKCGRGWTKDRIIAATDHFMKTYGRYPTAEEYSMEYGLPTHNTISAHFGIPAGVYWKQRYPMTEQGWSMDTILQAFEHFIQEHGRLPLVKELHPPNGLPCSQTIAHCSEIKKYSEFCRAYFPEYARQAKWNRERCIQGLEQFLQEHGRCPTQEEHKQHEYLACAITFTRHVGESESQYCKRQHPELSRYWTESKAINALDQFVVRNGRPPVAVEFCSANQLPSYVCFINTVGMPLKRFLRERYPEYYAQLDQEQDSGQTMQML